MRELHRILRPGGWAILQVPIMPAPSTFEDPTVNSREGRERVFGQHDHVRIYGRDYLERLRDAGFTVQDFACSTLLDPATIEREALVSDEEVFLCTRPVGPA